MRKITINSVNAFLLHKNFNGGNARVETNNSHTVMYLFNNPIAYHNKENGKITVQNCGWFSNTTKERLNGIPGVDVQQKKHCWYLNGKRWNGKLVNLDGSEVI